MNSFEKQGDVFRESIAKLDWALGKKCHYMMMMQIQRIVETFTLGNETPREPRV